MLFLVLAAIMWGSSFPVITYALRDVSPMLFVALRFSLAFVLLSAAVRRGFGHIFRRDVFLLSIPNALSFMLQYRAQELTTASKTALFVNSSPIFTVLLTVILLRERPAGRQLIATVVAMAGVITTSTGLKFTGLSAINVGDVLAVLVGLAWAVFIVASRGTAQRLGAYRLAQGLYFWSAVMTLPLLLVEDVHFSWAAAPAVGYLALFSTTLAYFCFLRGVRTVAPVATSVVILVEVVVAFAISHTFLGETFTAVESTGVAMVVAGVLLVFRK